MTDPNNAACEALEVLGQWLDPECLSPDARTARVIRTHQTIAALRAALEYAIREADAWHDDCRSGPVVSKEMDAARALLAARPSVPQGDGLAYSQDAAEEIQARAYAVGFAAGRDAARPSAPTVVQKPLTRAQISRASGDAQIAFCLNKQPTYDVAFAREVERLHGIGKEGGA